MTSQQSEQQLQLLNGQRQKGESDAAVTACNDYLRMGSGRSLSGLVEQYQNLSNFQRDYKPPSKSYGTIATWSSAYAWAERANAFDAEWEQRKNSEREAVLSYGLALDYERLRKLYMLASFLEAQIYERGEDKIYHNIWLPDVKQIGSGQDAERVDIERFNAPLLEQYRKVLEDIAKEVGGRVDNKSISGGLAIQWVDALADDDDIGIGANELPDPR